MPTLNLNPMHWLAEAGRQVHVQLSVRANSLANRQWEHPWQHQLMRGTAGMTFLGLAAGSAHADGLADMVSKGADQGDAIKTYAGRLFAAGGFVLASYGGFNWWRSGKEGEHTQIKGKQIWMPIVGGMALGATGFLLVKAGETIGISADQQGQLPN